MDDRFLALIRSFQSAAASALAEVLARTGLTHPFERRKMGIARSATLDGDPPLTYEFHGAGLRVQVWGREIDFDFGFDGRTGGFSAWWLSRFADHGTEEFPEFREQRVVDMQLARGIASGEIVQPFVDREDSLYYLASDVANDVRTGA